MGGKPLESKRSDGLLGFVTLTNKVSIILETTQSQIMTEIDKLYESWSIYIAH